MWIQNVSKGAVEAGYHKVGKVKQEGNRLALLDTVLISINDPCCFTEPLYVFKDRLTLEFLDLEEDDDFGHEFKITQEQADSIIKFLLKAKENGYNAVVHCTAGVCRSGAVAEVGVMLGFEDLKVYRQPNLMVKKYLMNSLGYGYDKGEGNVF